MINTNVKEKPNSIFRQFFQNLQQNNGVVIWIMLLILVIFSAVASPNFLTVVNIKNIFRQGALLGVIAIGQTIVLLSGGADLSQSAVMTMAAVVALDVLNGDNSNIPLVILISAIMGIVAGIFNGFIISKIKVPPFLLTLGTREVIYGLALVYTNGTPKGKMTPEFRNLFGQFSFLGIPGQIIIWAALVIIFWIILKKTEFGRKLYATGGNSKAARQSGIRTDAVITKAYILSGVLAALGGLVLAARAGYADNVIGQGYELNAVAASVIGGT